MPTFSHSFSGSGWSTNSLIYRHASPLGREHSFELTTLHQPFCPISALSLNLGFGGLTHWIILNHRQWSVRSRPHKGLEVARHCHRYQAHGDRAGFGYHSINFLIIRVERRTNVFLPSMVLCSGDERGLRMKLE